MAKSVIFQVRGNRIQFRCPACKARRNLPVPPNVRWRNVKCHRCDTKVKCILNRRVHQRESQTGKATMILREGNEVTVDLHDISPIGVGCNVPYKGLRKISVNDEVKFRCSWNPNLFKQSRYSVTSIKGSRVGTVGVGYKPLTVF